MKNRNSTFPQKSLFFHQNGRWICILQVTLWSAKGTLYWDVTTLYSSITTEKFRLIPPSFHLVSVQFLTARSPFLLNYFNVYKYKNLILYNHIININLDNNYLLG